MLYRSRNMARRSPNDGMSLIPTSSQKLPGQAHTQKAFFRPKGLQQHQCLALKNDGSQCCNKVGYSDLDNATKRMHRVSKSNETENDLHGIFEFLVCKLHRKTISSQMDGLCSRFEAKLSRYINTLAIRAPVSTRPSKRNSNTTLRAKLESHIEEKQFPNGFIYVFRTASDPQFVKIGCSNHSPTARVAQWAKCYPEAKLLLKEAFDFPQRIEELIHLQLADKRVEMQCDVPSCKSGFHDEWFECSVEEARVVIQDWKKVSTTPLYDNRQLRSVWRDVLQIVNGQDVTAANLLEAKERQAVTDFSTALSMLGALSLRNQ